MSASLLAGARPKPDAMGVLAVVRGLNRVQLDPTRSVERSHLLVLWSRLGRFDRADLDRLLWQERRLFEYDAWIVPTESYPWMRVLMRLFATRDAAYERRARAWMAENDRFHRQILGRLRHEGPLPSRAISAGPEVISWRSGGWTTGRNVSQMLHFMHRAGEILVARRSGNEREWDLADRILPSWTPRDELPPDRLLHRWIERLVRRRGIVEPQELPPYVALATRSETRAAVAELAADGTLVPVRTRAGFGSEVAYVHRDDVGRLDAIGAGEWEPRTTLLSPFDPLIVDRQRTERLFGFRYRIEIYVPKERRSGYFVMPVLDGDRLIGRIEPIMDRRSGRLRIRRLELAPDADRHAAAITDLATFLGASEVIDE